VVVGNILLHALHPSLNGHYKICIIMIRLYMQQGSDWCIRNMWTSSWDTKIPKWETNSWWTSNLFDRWKVLVLKYVEYETIKTKLTETFLLPSLDLLILQICMGSPLYSSKGPSLEQIRLRTFTTKQPDVLLQIMNRIQIALLCYWTIFFPSLQQRRVQKTVLL
jgi:hypothetical protein